MRPLRCRIAHITDLHLAKGGEKIYDLVDTAGAAERVVAAVNQLDPQPDVVLVTGDITHNGDQDAARRAVAILDGLNTPYRIANGNHDCRKTLALALGRDPQKVAASGLVGVKDHAGVRCIAVDTAVNDPRKSAFTETQLAFLEQILSKDTATPTVIFMHHPPFDTGIGWLDEMKPEQGRDEFGVLLQKHPQVLAVLCGHLHRPMRGEWYGVPVFAAPSVMNPVDFAPRCEGDEITLVVKSPPGFAVYDIAQDNSMSADLLFLDGHTEDWQYACRNTVVEQMIAE